MKKIFFLISFLCYLFSAHAQIISTIAGDSSAVYNGDNIPAISAGLYTPSFVALDGLGNFYFSEWGANRIRKVNNAGIITTIAGDGIAAFSGDGGPATASEVSGPDGLKFDKSGNLYFADDGNARVRRIDTAGIITTVAGTGDYSFSGDGGPATAAALNNPHDVAIDDNGNVYFTDLVNACVRKVNTAGIISTIAGAGTAIGRAVGNSGDGGPATAALLFAPYGIALDARGNIYIADYYNENIRKVDADGIISTIAGIGRTSGYNGDSIAATTANLNGPSGIAVDNDGNLYVGDAKNFRLREVSIGGIITTIAGNGFLAYNGDGILATVASVGPIGVTLDNKGSIYIADYGHDRIRYIRNTLAVNITSGNTAEMSITPNPSNDNFTININSANEEEAHILITDINGAVIKKINAATNKPVNIHLDVPSGI